MNPGKGYSLSTLTFFLTFYFCTSIDTITPSHSIRDGDLLVSSEQNFALGFFSPRYSTRRYVGIWYQKVSETVVWVANRDNPVSDKSGVLAINNQGNLVIYAENRTLSVWSTNISASSVGNVAAQLLDSGNLVLVQQDSESVLWQSFDYPTDTQLPYMKLGRDRRTGLDWTLSSWKAQDDPGTGNVLYKIELGGYPQLFLYKDKVALWRTGPWTGKRWSGIPEMKRNYIFNVSFVNNDNEVSIVYRITKASFISIMTVKALGSVQRTTWNDRDHQWIRLYSAPKEQCDQYNLCGANGLCDPSEAENFVCKCLPGFKPKSPQDWYLRDGSGGCIRKAGVTTCRSGEGFVKVARVKVPDTSTARAEMNLGLKACEEECLKNCNCTAYANADERGFGCLMWYGDLVDTRTFANVGQEVYVRVDAAELAEYARTSNGVLKQKGAVAILVLSVASVWLALIIVACFWIRNRKKKGKKKLNKKVTTALSRHQDTLPLKELKGSRIHPDLTFFDHGSILAATNNFSEVNKIGEGGFGSVYKGQLSNGLEIAVKRLSKNSGQGIEEFTNEVLLIAKLQHRNLVKLLGCCVEGEEPMLVYEYMPNKSLYSFLSNDTKRSLLDWSKRFSIIVGVARGVLYLHQDSRLRIIHRDLKSSNILLDAEMNPKISDFGIARICKDDQIQGNTKRVVGTYGYMSPEYAVFGKFSVKSDVFSFGIILLEIISGRKNSDFFKADSSLSLIEHVWRYWSEGRALEIVDPSLESYPSQDILRCVQIGLLCVQEDAMDRPTMLTVVSMLTSETLLPSPKQPAFILRRHTKNAGPELEEHEQCSINELTLSEVVSR